MVTSAVRRSAGRRRSASIVAERADPGSGLMRNLGGWRKARWEPSGGLQTAGSSPTEATSRARLTRATSTTTLARCPSIT